MEKKRRSLACGKIAMTLHAKSASYCWLYEPVKLQKHEFERWGEIQSRGFAAVSAQHELLKAVHQRVRANFECGAALDQPGD